MTAKQDIADALNTVEGINVYPGFRESTAVGDGWMTLRRMEPASNGFGYIHTWNVVIVIPGLTNSAEEWLDNNLEPLADAVARQLDVISITPTEIPLKDSSGATVANIYAVVIQGTRD